MATETVCRTCLQVCETSDTTHLNVIDKNDCTLVTLRQKIQLCAPELTLDIVHDPVVCHTCYAAILLAYQFKTTALESEKTLHRFIKHRQENPYDLVTNHDLLKIAYQGISAEHNYFHKENFSSDTDRDHLEEIVQEVIEDTWRRMNESGSNAEGSAVEDTWKKVNESGGNPEGSAESRLEDGLNRRKSRKQAGPRKKVASGSGDDAEGLDAREEGVVMDKLEYLCDKVLESDAPSKRSKSEARAVPRAHRYKKSRRYHCTKCNQSYNFRSHFDVHLKSHIIKKLYSCPVCGKDFAQEKYLKAHATLHSGGGGNYQCDICLKNLSASTALKRHYVTHTGEKPHACGRCGKGFAQKIQLHVHMRIHTGSRPFACNVCGASFTQKSHLLGHLRVHTGEKPYKCEQCPKQFRKAYALQIHRHSHSVKPFQCKVCNFLLKDAEVLQRHLDKHLVRLALKGRRSRRRVLDDLEQDVQTIAELSGNKQGAKALTHFCCVCERGFTTKFSMKRHMNVHVKKIE